MNGNGKEYALAMFGIALEKDSMDQMKDDLVFIKDAINENPEYLEYLINPAVPKSERLDSISKVFEESVCEDVFSFLSILCGHGDMYILTSAIEEFELMYQDFKKYAKAVITSAVELTEDQKSRLISKLQSVTKKRIDPEYVIDKNLMGGLMVTVDGKIYDGSVRKNLNNIKEVIS